MSGLRLGIVVSLAAMALLAGANWPPPGLADGVTASRVEVLKSRRLLRLYDGDTLVKEYDVALGGAPVGHKQSEGDERTPEGRYSLDDRNPQSAFYRSLHVSYPRDEDVERAAAAGVDPGGMIMIQGLPNGLGWVGRLHRLFDWTDGCVAVTNPEMDEIWRAVPDGTPIELRP